MPRFVLAIFALAIFFSPATRADEKKIRDFNLETIEELGKELYRRDHLASEGTDLMLERYPGALQEFVAGWISILGEESSVLYFLRSRDDRLSLAYTVTFPREGQAVVKDQVGEAVPEMVRTRFRARQTALAAVPKFYTPRTNVEVLDDPDGDGFLVYVLASTTNANEIVVGGHYRITVSADGRRVESVDALSRSLLIVPVRSPDMPKDSELAARMVTHLVSPTPVETHVFVSLLYRTPFYVATGEDELWEVKEGKIRKAAPAK